MKNTGWIKITLLVAAVLVAFSFLYISGLLVNDLSQEEKKRMEIWAEAMQTMKIADENMDLNLVLNILNSNTTIPVVVVDKNGYIQTHRNVRINSKDSLASLNQELNKLKQRGNLIRMNYLLPGDTNADETEYIDVFYADSTNLKRLSVYPYIQLLTVLVFISIVVFALLSFKKSEQNMIWVGLSKETAHQLGTPISSLMAWLELMKIKYEKDELLSLMYDDVLRLQVVASRFSKIGSIPELQQENLLQLVDRTVDYMAGRTSTKIKVLKCYPDYSVCVLLNAPLFSWVIENIYKNAVDAMEGQGQITVALQETSSLIYIDISDTGKGISRNSYKKVFAPGVTTKKRGWGLGLSLVKKIVEEYHHGSIYVKESLIGGGTTFRIELKK